MLRHVALFRWLEDTPAERIAEVTRRLGELPGRITEIQGFAVGPDVGGADGHWDFAVVADFADMSAYRAYAAHPDHLAAVTEAIVPIRAERAVLQYEVG